MFYMLCYIYCPIYKNWISKMFACLIGAGRQIPADGRTSGRFDYIQNIENQSIKAIYITSSSPIFILLLNKYKSLKYSNLRKL